MISNAAVNREMKKGCSWFCNIPYNKRHTFYVLIMQVKIFDYHLIATFLETISSFKIHESSVFEHILF